MKPHRIGTLVLALLLALAPAARAAEHAPAPAKKLTASRAFLTLNPFMVSIVENYKVRGFLVLEVTLHMPRKDGQEGAEIMSPKLRDSFVRMLMEYGAKIATIKRPPDLTGITARLQEQTDGVLGPGKARVLLQAAGFKVARKYSKKREEFLLGKAHVTIDQLQKKGWFLEIEGKPAEIAGLEKKLGLSAKDREERTYLEILEK